jgi:prenyltransferase beta subunit
MSITSETENVVFGLFDVDLPQNLEQLHSDVAGTPVYYQAAVRYFRRRWTSLMGDLSRSRPLFLSELFYVAIGSLITGSSFAEQDSGAVQSYLNKTRTRAGGFLPVEPEYLKRFPNLSNARQTPIVPEVYSTYYGYHLAKLIGVRVEDEARMCSWVVSLKKPSGLIYNSEYSDTAERIRMESERTFQLYCALSLIKSLDSGQLTKVSSKARDYVSVGWKRLKTIAGRHFALKALSLADPEALADLDRTEIESFLLERKDPEGPGYYDYRLADKIDESMGSRAAIELDKITSHMFSSFYAISMAKRLNLTNVFSRNDLSSLLKSCLNPDGGFGRQVMIKDFKAGFGPTSTDLETVLATLSPSLLS